MKKFLQKNKLCIQIYIMEKQWGTVNMNKIRAMRDILLFFRSLTGESHTFRRTAKICILFKNSRSRSLNEVRKPVSELEGQRSKISFWTPKSPFETQVFERISTFKWSRVVQKQVFEHQNQHLKTSFWTSRPTFKIFSSNTYAFKKFGQGSSRIYFRTLLTVLENDFRIITKIL